MVNLVVYSLKRRNTFYNLLLLYQVKIKQLKTQFIIYVPIHTYQSLHEHQTNNYNPNRGSKLEMWKL